MLTMEYAVWKAVRLTIVTLVAAVVTAALAPDWRLTIIVAVSVFVVGLALSLLEAASPGAARALTIRKGEHRGR